MIQSMTAFARGQTNSDSGLLICELRSINHRYLEISLRAPEFLHAIEPLLRDQIRQHLKRGKIECFLRVNSGDKSAPDFKINTKLVKQIVSANKTISKITKSNPKINPMDILKWPGILEINEFDLEVLQEHILKLLSTTLKNLIVARENEGKELKKLILERTKKMLSETANVRARLPLILKQQRERLYTKFSEANVELDNSRLEQELVLFAQKIDVAEELDRLEAHVKEVKKVLQQGSAVGRRLDFLMQELNREANTLGSKSVDLETTRAAVELKVLIEQMREQVQNIE